MLSQNNDWRKVGHLSKWLLLVYDISTIPCRSLENSFGEEFRQAYPDIFQTFARYGVRVLGAKANI
jgi:hypothetical protein